MSNIEKDLLLAVADLHQVPSGAFSLRENGSSAEINSTANIEVVKKTDKQGIDIYVKKATKFVNAKSFCGDFKVFYNIICK